MDPAILEWRVSYDLAGTRLDRALGLLVDDISRARLKEMIEDGRVQVDGQLVTRPSLGLREGQNLRLEVVERDRSRRGDPGALELAILYEDETLVAVLKPAGMVVHPGPTVSGGTVSERLVERYGPLPSPQGEDRPGIVHRLDADTSGVLVAARTAPAAASLLDQFARRTVEKRYLALVHGDPRFDSDWIEAPLGRSPTNPDRISVVDAEEGRAAQTFYEVQERCGAFALVACSPKTGRTHQIRVHLAHAGHPLVGDRLYRGRRGLRRSEWPAEAPRLSRHALHAQSLALDHPASGERMRFEAPLAQDMELALAWLRQRPSS